MTNQPPPEQPHGQQQPQQPWQGQGGQPGPYGPPPGWQQPQPPAKKRRGCLIAALVIVAVVIIGAVSCVAIAGSAVKSVDDQSKQQHTVLYEVTGTGKADITYSTDAQGSSAQESGATLPWSKTEQSAGFFRVYTLLAQNGMDSSGGELTCKITVDGKLVKTATAKGAGAIASCTYSE